jgi:hypothetical protein
VMRGKAPGEEEEDHAEEERSRQADEEAPPEEDDSAERRGKHEPIGGEKAHQRRRRAIAIFGRSDTGFSRARTPRSGVPGAALVQAQVVKEQDLGIGGDAQFGIGWSNMSFRPQKVDSVATLNFTVGPAEGSVFIAFHQVVLEQFIVPSIFHLPSGVI